VCAATLTAQEADPAKNPTPVQVPKDQVPKVQVPEVPKDPTEPNDPGQASSQAPIDGTVAPTQPVSVEPPPEPVVPAALPPLQIYVPLDLTHKFLYSFNEMMGPPRWIGLTVKAGLDQAQKSPAAWGSGIDSFGVRVASRFGRAFLREDIAFGVRAFDHEDPRYFRAGIGTGHSRTKSALYQTFMARKDNVPGGNTWMPAYSRFLSDFAMPFLAQTWRPEPLNVARGFRQGSLALGMTFGSNLWQEFWPDIRKRFKILRHAPSFENGVLIPAPSVP
jgi:hypothetical protein